MVDTVQVLKQREERWRELSAKNANGRIPTPVEVKEYIELRQQRVRAGKKADLY